MFQKLTVFESAFAMAQYAGSRQAVVSENIANADTPGYVAKDVMKFQEFLSNDGMTLRASRARHMHGVDQDGFRVEVIESRAGNSPNGNSVEIESEMFKAVEAKRQHDRAMAIYRSTLDVLRMSLGKQ